MDGNRCVDDGDYLTGYQEWGILDSGNGYFWQFAVGYGDVEQGFCLFNWLGNLDNVYSSDGYLTVEEFAACMSVMNLVMTEDPLGSCNSY